MIKIIVEKLAIVVLFLYPSNIFNTSVLKQYLLRWAESHIHSNLQKVAIINFLLTIFRRERL